MPSGDLLLGLGSNSRVAFEIKYRRVALEINSHIPVTLAQLAVSSTDSSTGRPQDRAYTGCDSGCADVVASS